MPTYSSSSSSGITLTNVETIAASGTIAPTAANAIGVDAPGIYSWTVDNAGLISTPGSHATGVYLHAVGVVSNASTGTISANAASGYGVVLHAGGSVTNSAGGTISAYQAISATTATATVVNGGSISGAGGFGIDLKAGGTITNLSGGTISGATDAVLLAAGFANRVVVALGAAFTGTVNGGNAIGASVVSTLELASGAGAGTLSGLGTQFIDLSQITVDAGATWLLSGNNTLAGQTISGAGTWRDIGTLTNIGMSTFPLTLGAGGILNNIAGATIATSGSLNAVYAVGAATVVNAGKISGGQDAVLFKAGFASRLIIDPGGTFSGTVDGGNTAGASVSSTLELAVGTTAGTLTGLGTQFIDFSQIVVDAGANWTLSGSNTLVSGVTVGGAGSFSNAGTLSNSGSISQVLILDAGATLINAHGVIGSGAVSYGISAGVSSTMVNSGHISGSSDGILLSLGGFITNQSGGTIVSVNGVYAPGATTITNAGTIEGSASGYGIKFRVGGAVTNFASGVIYGGKRGFNGSGKVVNYGTITGGYALRGVGAVVTNQSGGLISGTSFGVYDFTGGSVTNTAGGTIKGAMGVEIEAGNATVVNAGTIIGNGGTSVELAFGSTNLLLVDPGAKFTGFVLGGAFPGFGNSVLELASGASAGTLAGLGSQYVEFVQFKVDSGAQWTLSGTNTVSSGESLTNNGTLNVSIGNLVVASTLTNNGLLETTGGTLEVGTIVSGTGQLAVASGGTLQIDSAIGSGQTVAFGSGAADKLILSAPGTVFSNAITGFAAGDRIELGSGVTITGASINVSGTVTLITNSGSYVLNDVSTVAAGVGSFVVGTDTVTGDSYAQAVQGPQTDVWIGASGGNVATAGNWNDVTTGTNPAAAAPGMIDAASFLSGGGVLTGTDTVSVLQFGSGGVWSLGSGAALTASSAITIGSGVVAIGAGASIVGKGTFDTISGTGLAGASVLVEGATAKWQSAGTMVVGGTGVGNLSISGAGTVIAAGATIANTSTASGSSVNVTGTGSDWTVSGALLVGNAGAGSLNITAGGTVSATSLDAGVISSGSIEGTGQISLSGPGSDLAITGNAIIGDAGSANLSILDGATLSAANLTIGSQGSGSGSALVSDTGSVLHLTGTLNVGTPLGVGELTIGPSATIIASKVVLNGEIVDEGGLLDPNEIDFTPGNGFVGFGTVGGLTDLIVNTGTIEAAAGSKPTQKTLTVEGTVSGVGGLLQIDAGSTMVVTGPVRSGQTIAFGGTSAALVLGDAGGFAGTVTTFHVGDELIVSGTSVVAESFVNNVLTLFASGTTVLGTVTFAPGAVSGGYLSLDGSGGVTSVACFAAGTRIGTERGEVRVEDLTAGDLVRTVLGDALAPVVWVGHRTVDCARHPKPEAVWPVRVRAGAFGANVPVRDVYLSPDHAVYLNEVLIPVKHLVNGSSVAQVPTDTVTYYHVELPEHDVVLAENLPAESYLETGDRANFANAGAVVRQFPDFSARAWDALGCAPLVVTGAVLERARADLAGWAPEAARQVA